MLTVDIRERLWVESMKLLISIICRDDYDQRRPTLRNVCLFHLEIGGIVRHKTFAKGGEHHLHGQHVTDTAYFPSLIGL